MHLKLLTSVAVLLAVAACSTAQEESATYSSTGAQTGTQTTATTTTGEPAVIENIDRIQGDSLTSIGDRVFFDLDRSDLSPEAQDTLRDLASWLSDRPDVSIALEGHADERGTREYNLALGSRRANAARDYLVALGIDERRLTTVSYGKERPEIAGSSEGSWAQNRRSVFVVK